MQAAPGKGPGGDCCQRGLVLLRWWDESRGVGAPTWALPGPAATPSTGLCCYLVEMRVAGDVVAPLLEGGGAGRRGGAIPAAAAGGRAQERRRAAPQQQGQQAAGDPAARHRGGRGGGRRRPGGASGPDKPKPTQEADPAAAAARRLPAPCTCSAPPPPRHPAPRLRPGLSFPSAQGGAGRGGEITSLCHLMPCLCSFPLVLPGPEGGGRVVGGRISTPPPCLCFPTCEMGAMDCCRVGKKKEGG